MNDPTTSPTRAQDGSGSNIQEIYFSPTTWEQGVKFYQQVLGVEPNPAGPPTAEFKPKEGYEIHVTQTTNKDTLADQTANRILALPVAEAQDVGRVTDIAETIGAVVILRPIVMDVFPVIEPPIMRHITISIVRFRAGQQATPDDTTVGVIHNPNW